MSKVKADKDKENKKLLIGHYNKSVILTYVGLYIALIGILICKKTEDKLLFLLIAGICDLFDGVIARKIDRTDSEKAFGVQIDSLVDVVSFLILPSVILFQLAQVDKNYTSIVTTITTIYCLAGITRLAWFNISKYNGSNKYLNSYFEGLPVTYSALILPSVYLIVRNFGDGVKVYSMILTYIALAVMFILNIKIKRPSGIWYKILPVIAFVIGCMLFS